MPAGLRGALIPAAIIPRVELPLLSDGHGRPLRSLRLSVTDRCNLRCSYCMPEEHYTWLGRDRLLRFGQLTLVARSAVGLGVRRIRLTGGEPLLRKELWRLVEQLRAIQQLEDLALTTNGIHLEEQAEALRAAGLDRVTISLDTLDRGRFEALTRRDDLSRVLAGVAAARRTFPSAPKVNTVLMAGINDGEIPDLLRWAREERLELRFIEYMDVEGATQWSGAQVLSAREVLERVEQVLGPVTPMPGRGSAPAQRYRLESGQVFGIVASTTQPFCGHCDRARLTADGQWFNCLYATEGLDLGPAIRSGANEEQLAEILAGSWRRREDRGAEERLLLPERETALTPSSELRSAPQREMHTKGG